MQPPARYSNHLCVYIDQRANDQKYPRYPLVLKLNVTLAWPLRLVILYFFNGNSCQMIGACIFMAANETPNLMWMSSPIQSNC